MQSCLQVPKVWIHWPLQETGEANGALARTPSQEQPLIRSTLADGIRAVIAQTLFKRIDRKGRVAALEILIANPAVRNLIREGKTHQIPSMIQTGKKYGMQLLDDAIMEHLNAGRISPDEAYMKSNEKGRFRPFLKNPPTDFTDA